MLPTAVPEFGALGALDKFGVKNLDADMMPGGNSQLLMRIGHPLSITNMGSVIVVTIPAPAPPLLKRTRPYKP